ncbi:MAG: TadE/TadG family type IV pilus assembly protein [Candidatus Limnocylindria bacterium]
MRYPGPLPSVTCVRGRDGYTLDTIRNFVRGEEGQNLVEFALLLPILLYILMGIIQFGLIFAVYVTINNSVREAARWGSIYVYDNDSAMTPTNNDTARNNGMVDRMYFSRGILNIPPRGTAGTNFTTASTGTLAPGSCPAQNPTPLFGWWYGASGGANPDVTICYSKPPDVLGDNDARRGYYLDVQAWYHLQVFIPLLQQFLPDDPSKPDNSSWIRLPGRITVVVN